MSITSFQFLGFVLITLILFRIFPLKRQWLVLLAASLVFYISFNFAGVFVMIGTSMLTYGAALWIQKYKDDHTLWLKENKKTADKETRKAKKTYCQKRQKLIVSGTVVIIIGILFLCKYYGVIATRINGLLNTQMWTPENILIPLGISYYSFQLIGYLIDVHRDIIAAEKNPLKVVLYGGFFLSIMQGPFNRYNDLMPQLCSNKRKFTSGYDYKSAILRITGGYIKKLCIADQVALISNEVFSNYHNHSGLGIVFGVVCFAVQLYADFSGYMDIIIGVGQLFGITMPENFRQPFFSKNISDFWKRWHITLGLWLQDYVFYPILKSSAFKNLGKRITEKVGKKAGRSLPTYLGMIILWTLIGAWHGAGFNYIFGVGLLQFIYIFTGEIFDPVFIKVKQILHIDDKKLYWRIVQGIRCTILMMFAWIFFNADSFSQAIVIIQRAFCFPQMRQITQMFYSGQITGNPQNWILFVIAAIIVLMILDILHENDIKLSDAILKKKFPIRLFVYLGLALSLLVFGAYGSQYDSNNFIYFNF